MGILKASSQVPGFHLQHSLENDPTTALPLSAVVKRWRVVKSNYMLPKVVRETDVHIFKFWFDGALQDGLHYDNELFYRALAVESVQRTRLYHLGCKLSEKGGTALVTLSEQGSSLWLSLRSQAVLAQIADNPVQGLPHLHL
jgi:hypothetical protein